MQVLIFKLNNFYYGFETLYIDEVAKRQPLVNLARSNDCVAGLANVRGKIYTCIDLCEVLFNTRAKWSKDQYFLLTSHGGRLHSYIVDEVVGVHDIDKIRGKALGYNSVAVRGLCVEKDNLITILSIEGVNSISCT